MNEYHCLYFKSPADLYCVGENIEAKSMIEAIQKFIDKFGFEPFNVSRK